MSYEVIKRRGKRAYRYTVEYYHDDTGKGRTRWHYVGPVDAETSAILPSARQAKTGQSDTAARLLDALERLLARSEFAEITASAIAVEAGVAHGTFYRHFKDKRDALRASMHRLAERAEHLAQLEEPGTDRERERERIREWISKKLTTVGEYPSVWRAWTALAERDSDIGDNRKAVRDKYRQMLETYLLSLRKLGFTNIEDIPSLSNLIFTLIYGVLQDRFVHRNDMPATEIIEQVCLMVDRTIFV